MFRKGVNWFGGILCILAIHLRETNGRSSYDLAPIYRYIRKPPELERTGTSAVNGSQQTTGSVYGFVNSTAEGNGEPNSAVAYAWQGGQTSAQGSQLASADSSNATAQTTGSSTCQQGYTGNANGATSSTSTGNALCNATHDQAGQYTVEDSEKILWKGKGKPPMFPVGPQHGVPLGPPQILPGPSQGITLNYTVAQTGEAQSGQNHNSLSNVGGPTGGLLSILAGGFANIPQGSMTFQHSALDPQGQAIQAVQDLQTDPGIQSEEETLIAVSGNQAGHTSGGLAHVFGLGNLISTNYNSHEPEEDDETSRDEDWRRGQNLTSS